MSKRFIIGAIAVILAGLGLASFLSRGPTPGNQGAIKGKELAERYAEVAARLGQPNVPTQAVLAPIDLSRPIRLAVGGLGLADDDQNRQLGDLVTVALTGAPGFELVERQSLAVVLRELNLSWSGFVRAKDAVRAGKLLKADWFLLGAEAKLNGTNSVVVRVVDARTGVMLDAGVVPADKPLTEIAAGLASFLRESRQNLAHPKPRVYLALGAFEDLSVNNRQADFPKLLRGYLTAAYRGSSVTLLEREYVETLLQEVHLDMAGLTDESWSNLPPAMQSAYWLVSGQYQSYETTNFQVELNLDVRRVFGKSWHRTLRGLPGEPVDRQIKAAIDEVMKQNAGAITPTRTSEARIQMDIGKKLSGVHKFSQFAGEFDSDLVWVTGDWDLDPLVAARQKRNLEEAMRAFETVLLLEPTNRTAKMYQAACLRNPVINRLNKARNYYREIIEEPVQDKWTALAQQALLHTFDRHWWGGPTLDDEIRWFGSAAGQTTSPIAAAFYSNQVEAVQQSAIIANGGRSPEVEAAAENSFCDAIRTFDGVMHGKGGVVDSGMNNFVRAFGTNQSAAALRLVEILPQMKRLAPDLEPYLLAETVTFQVDTNSPAVVEFERQFAQVSKHPRQVLGAKWYWELLGGRVYDWSVEHKFYDLAAKLMEGKFQMFTNHPEQGTEVDFNNSDKVSLGFVYMKLHRWENALRIFESFSNQPVRMWRDGPWGDVFTVVFPSKEADNCRQKLGLRAVSNPLEFSMGRPLLCLCSPSTFIADDGGLWIGIGGQLMHLGFDLKTNIVINLPMDPSTSITALCLTTTNVWIATYGEGLIEFDKVGRKCRRFTERDGMMMDNLASLCLVGHTLWIGYGKKTSYINGSYEPQPGGLGNLDLTTSRFMSFSPSLAGPENGNFEKPTRHSVTTIAAGVAGDIWFVTDEVDPAPHLHRYQPVNNLWKIFQNNCTAIAQNKQQLALAQFFPPVLNIFNFDDGHWRSLKAANQLPSKLVSTMTLDGNDLWVGGMGYIALVDSVQDKVLHFAYVKAENVDRLQVAGGYLWAQFDWHLYRVPLSAVE